MKKPCTGYYSVIQYCPDHSRQEVANIGVLLFVPSLPYLQTRMAPGNDRIRRFFGDGLVATKDINAMKHMVEGRISVEAGQFRTQEELERFLRLFANEIIFSELRSVRVENADAELAQLFEELVGGRMRREPPIPLPGMEQVRVRLQKPDVAGRLKTDVLVEVPVLGETLKADYAFQNGRFNLIQIKEFNQQRESDLLKEACRSAAEGHLIYRHPDRVHGQQQLVLVGSLREDGAESTDKLTKLFEEHEVVFFTDAQSEKLVELILRTSH